MDSPSRIVWHLGLQFILRLVYFITDLTHVNSGQYTLLSIIDAAFLLWRLTFDIQPLIACIITSLFNGDFICHPGDPNMDHKLEKNSITILWMHYFHFINSKPSGKKKYVMLLQCQHFGTLILSLANVFSKFTVISTKIELAWPY